MRLLPVALAFSLIAICYADVITLKNGRVINGTYLGGTPRQIKVEVGDNIQSVDVSDIARIEFGGGGGSASSRDMGPREAPADNGRPTLRRADSSDSSSSSYPGSGSGSGSGAPQRTVILQPDPNDSGSYPSSSSSGSSIPTDNSRPTLKRSSSSSSSSDSDSDRPTLSRPSSSDSTPAPVQPGDSDRPVLHRANSDAAASTPAPTAPSWLQIPANTEFTVRLIDAVDSQNAKEGDMFRASMDQPVVVNGQTLVARGADAQVKLVQAHQSGKFTGKTELTLSLWTVTVNNKLVPLDTQNITKTSGSRGEQTAKVAGGAAAAGAVIGAIAGGGKGAAAGAGAGAAGGAVVQAATKGERVKVASETLLTFALEKPVGGQDTAAAAPAAQAPPQTAQVTAPAQTPASATAAAPAPEAAPAAPPAIKIGQTEDSVIAALGQPDSVDATKNKQVYIYKNLKVTFINGKVSKVE